MKTSAFLLAAATLAAASTSHAALTDGLAGYFDFNGDIVNKAQSVGSNFTGTFGGASSNLTAPQGGLVSGGIVNGAYQFTVTGTTGVGNRLLVDIGYGTGVGSTGSTLGTTFTINAWYNLSSNTPPGNGDNRYFVYEGKTDFDASFSLRNVASTGSASLFDAQAFTGSAASKTYADFGSAGWHMVTQTYVTDGTTTTITTYIDGIKQIDASALTYATASIADSGLNIGAARNGTNTRGFDGKVDELGLWNRTLSDSDIATLYNSGTGLAITAVPEPSTYGLMGAGALAAAAFVRRRRRA